MRKTHRTVFNASDLLRFEPYNNKKKLNALDINYLINIGPDHLGRFPLEAQEILLGVSSLEKSEK